MLIYLVRTRQGPLGPDGSRRTVHLPALPPLMRLGACPVPRRGEAIAGARESAHGVDYPARTVDLRDREPERGDAAAPRARQPRAPLALPCRLQCARRLCVAPRRDQLGEHLRGPPPRLASGHPGSRRRRLAGPTLALASSAPRSCPSRHRVVTPLGGAAP